MDRTSEQPSTPPDHRGPTGRALALLVVAATLFAGLAACSVSSAGAADVRLDQASEAGPDPFTGSVSVTAATELPTEVRAAGASLLDVATRVDDGPAPLTLTGTEPGLYGGSNREEVCDPERLVAFLKGDDAKARAWAAVFDIPVSGIAAFVAGLTPTVLLVDTRVTNHGFGDGSATDVQAVLQAGTAVLVDDRGTPRVKCSCGNPLTPPAEVRSAEYTGERWTGFDPDTLVVVEAGTPAEVLTVVDLETGERIELPVGSRGDVGSTPAEGTTTTTRPTPTSTTTTPPTPTTTAPPSRSSPLGPAPTLTDTAASGAGCTPGQVAVLPDGWWFGFDRTAVRAGASFDFDLACFYYGAIGGQKAHEEDPAQYPTTEPVPNDVYVSNQNTTIRSVSVAPTAELRCIDMATGALDHTSQIPCPSPGGGEWSIWVRIEGGVATRIVEQFRP